MKSEEEEVILEIRLNNKEGGMKPTKRQIDHGGNFDNSLDANFDNIEEFF